LTRWNFGDVPREWRFRQAGVDIVAYPGLVDKTSHIDLELFDYPAQALQQQRRGVLRLLRLHSTAQVKYLLKQLLKGNKFNLVIAGAQLDRGSLLQDLVDGAYVWAMKQDDSLPFEQREFEQVLQTGKAQVIACANELENILFNTLDGLAELRREMARIDAGKFPVALEDINSQLQRLLQVGFLRDTPRDWLCQYPRYMKALTTRLQRLSGQAVKDEKYTQMLESVEFRLWKLGDDRPGLLQMCPQARQYRWMLEEFRVSLFSQNLGTRLPISEKRLREQWHKVEQWVSVHPR
jgi:ATP-dependent helicase HrpA